MPKLSPRQMFLLDEACKPIVAAFGESLYLVGSSLESISYRDIDVRLILDDEKYDALLTATSKETIAFLGLSIGEYLVARSRLPIDFQLQRRTEANNKHRGRRNPLGLRDLSAYAGDAPLKDRDGLKHDCS